MRRSAAQVAIALNIVFGVFIVGSLGLVSYEMSRILLAREQLRHCLELTSLGGGAALASTSLTGAAAQAQATTIAMNILKKNSILGQSLTGRSSQVASIAALNPTPGQVNVCFEFVDPINKQTVASGTDTGVLKVHGAYAYPLFSGGFGSIGVSTYTLVSEATAGMPAIDLAIVYNNSGSMDDQTKVTMVRRYWDYTDGNSMIYHTPRPGGTPAEGTIVSLVCPNPQGTQLNALEPQNLDAAGDSRTALCPKEFSEGGTTGLTVPLRGFNDNSPPGDTPPSGGVGIGGMTAGPGYTTGAPGSTPGLTNMGNITMVLPFGFDPLPKKRKVVVPQAPRWWKETVAALPHILEQPAYAHYTLDGSDGPDSYNPWNANGSLFTDMVVNLDGNTHFAGNFTDPAFPGFTFVSLDYLVEAARGNMENGGVAPNAWISTNLDSLAQPGWQNAYMCSAYKQMQPKITVDNAVTGFIRKMAQSSDCHFAFIAYNERAGLTPTDTMTAYSCSYLFPSAGTVNYLVPQIPLSSAGSNITAINTLLTPPVDATVPIFVPNGGSNLASGLQQAVENLRGPNARSGAYKAIVVVTDQVPTRDLSGNAYSNPASNGAALTDAIAKAQVAKNFGIPIFVVGLAQNGTIGTLMGSQYDDASANGVVGAAGNGGTTQIDTWVDPVTTQASLLGKFNSLARQLITLVNG